MRNIGLCAGSRHHLALTDVCTKSSLLQQIPEHRDEPTHNRCVARNGTIVKEEQAQVNTVGVLLCDCLPGLQDRRVDGKCEQCWSKWVSLLNAAFAADFVVSEQQAAGRSIAIIDLGHQPRGQPA